MYWRSHYLSIHDRTTILDFKNRDFQDCKRTQEYPYRRLQEASHHSRRKSSIGEMITYEQLGWSTTSAQIGGDNEAILDFRELSKVQSKSDNVQDFDTKVGRTIVSSQWQTYWQHIGSRHGSRWHKIRRNRDEDRPATGAPSKGKADREKQRTFQKQLRERRLHTLDYDMPMFIWRFVPVQAWRKQEAQGKGRPHSLSPTESPRQHSKGDGQRWWWRRCKRHT